MGKETNPKHNQILFKGGKSKTLSVFTSAAVTEQAVSIETVAFLN